MDDVPSVRMMNDSEPPSLSCGYQLKIRKLGELCSCGELDLKFILTETVSAVISGLRSFLDKNSRANFAAKS
jgi:hypothetical protein